MLKIAHKYFVDFLTKGDESVTSEIFSDDCVHVDKIWDAVHPTVGVEGMRHYLHDLKTTFPDFWIEIGEISTCEASSRPFLHFKCFPTAPLPLPCTCH